MAYIRIKKVKGLEYYYLVKSQWDPIRKVSNQHTIKYLGKASNVTINDVPFEVQKQSKNIIYISPNSKERP